MSEQTTPTATATASPWLTLPGAVPAHGADAGVAAHYGDPMREQRRLAAGQAVVDLSHRGVLRLSGADRLTWLHSLTSQALDALPVGSATEALVLSPQGHVEHHLRVVDDGEHTWCTVEPGTAPALVAFLERMRFMLAVEVVDVTAQWAVLWAGPGETLVRRADLLGEDGRAAVPAGLPNERAGVWAYEALRIARGEARLGLDTDHRTIPNEVGWIGSAVALDKGCYRGQETVARVHNLGRPPRRLVRLHLDGSAVHLPAHGDAVWMLGTDGMPASEVGFIGSAARHFEDGPIALALVKRAVPIDAPLVVLPRAGDPTAPSVAAAQDVVVDPEVGLHVRPQLR